MTTKKLLTAAALVGALTVAVTGVSTDGYAMQEGMEKCYGVVKAGKNDCGANGHSCAGQAATDSAAKEWVMTPKGLCDKLAGGHVMAAGDHGDMKGMAHDKMKDMKGMAHDKMKDMAHDKMKMDHGKK